MTNLKLTHRAWKEFPFSDIFTKIQRGKRLTKSNQIEGEIPYVSSTATNNGVDNFIANSENVRMFNNCLSLANSGSVGSVFYHHYTFVGSDHITALELDKPNKYIYLFLSGVIKRLEEKYSFNREINDVRIKREKILLPIDQDENPDWQFMEDFMRKIEQDKVKTILEYYQNMPKCQWGGVNRKVHFDSWQEFEIESLFEIFTGKDLILSNVKEGKIPVVSHKDNENGIHIFSDFIENNIIHNSNTTISLADRGTFKAFIQPANFYVGTRVKALKFKKNVSKEIQKFVVTSINKQSELFSYGRNACQRLNKTKIFLPTKNNGIDWQGMEEFIKQKELEKIVDVLKYYQE